jgi:hypothetical protein
MMRDIARQADFWRLLTRVRALRVRRRLRALAAARRYERGAAAVVAERVVALERHAEERRHVLLFCRRDQRAGGQWHATLRAHDERTPALQQRLGEARQAHAAARFEADGALRDWRVERFRHDDAKQRWRIAVARVAGAADGGCGAG